MRADASIAVSLLGLLVAAPAFAAPQGGAVTIGSRSPLILPPAVIDDIRFAGLHRIPAEAAVSQIPFKSGDHFSSAKITAAVHALDQTAWFQDVVVKEEMSQTAGDGPPRVNLEFQVTEYPILAGVAYTGSKLLSQQQIKKLLQENTLLPDLGIPLNPAKLHRVEVLLQSQLAAMGHPQSQVAVVRKRLSGQGVQVEFQVDDGPRLPVVAVHFSGDPQLPESVLRKQMREISPEAWFSALRDKNVFTRQKVEQDRLNLLTYLQNHGFPQARVGTPHITLLDTSSSRPFPWLQPRPEYGLNISLPVQAGNLYTFGPLEISSDLHQKLGAKKHDPLLSNVAPGHPFSQRAVDSLQRSWEVRLHRKVQHHKAEGDYRLRATPTFDSAKHIASVKFDFDPAPPLVVRHLDFRGNQRFPDRFLRRRIGLNEGQPLDEYALEAGLARIAQTGYFQPFKKEDVQINTHESGHFADVTIHVHEKGRQRTVFSGGKEQFGSTLGVAYVVFNLLGMDEFMSTQLDGGPESLQLAIGLAKEGFLGSRGTLALSVFDTFLRPRFSPSVQAPFQRTRTEGANLGWTYAASDFDSIGFSYGISRSVTDYGIAQPANSSGTQPTDLRSATSSHSLGLGWTHYSGEQHIQLSDSVSGGLLGGSENLLKSQAEYGRIFPDPILDNHNAWAFRTTFRAVGSYQGDMPLYARFFSDNDLVRGLQPGQLGPYQAISTVSPSGTTTYSAAPTGANLAAASNLEYRIPLRHGAEGATFFDTGSGFLLPNWVGPSRPTLINATNGVIHVSTGLELRWTLPAVNIPLRVNYSFNLLRLNRAFLMPDGTLFRIHDHSGAFGWGLGQLF